MFCLCWQAFQRWLDQHFDQVASLTNQANFAHAVQQLQAHPTRQKLVCLLGLPGYACQQHVFVTFAESLVSPFVKLWISYFEIVHLLLQFLRANCKANWHLHMQSVRRMLPWMFAYDRHNCSCYLSLYWCQVSALEHKKLSLYNVLASGEFCAQKNSCLPFSQIVVDQAIEQTVNRDAKTKGGIIGFSQ